MRSSRMLGQAGLELPELTDSARDGINEVLQGFGWAANPADITGHASRDTIVPVLEHMVNEPEVGTLVVASNGNEAQANHIVEIHKKTDRAIAFLCTGNQSELPSGVAVLNEAKIPVFFSPQSLAFALTQLLDYHSWREDRLKHGFGVAAPVSDASKQIADSLISGDKQALTEHEGEQLLAAWGIPSADSRLVSSVDAT